jgi:hypothetical protein
MPTVVGNKRELLYRQSGPEPLLTVAPGWQVLPLSDGRLLLCAAEARADALVSGLQ